MKLVHDRIPETMKKRLRMAIIDNSGLTVHEIFYFQVCKNCNCYWQEHDHATGNCMFVPGGKYEIPDEFRPAGITPEEVRHQLRAFR